MTTPTPCAECGHAPEAHRPNGSCVGTYGGGCDCPGFAVMREPFAKMIASLPVRASRSAPGLREAVEALAKECEAEAAAHPDSYEWAPAHASVAKKLRAALSSTGTPATACSACSGTGKRPVYSAGEEMVAGFEPCAKCAPAPSTGTADGADRPCPVGCGPCHEDPSPWHERGCPRWRAMPPARENTGAPDAAEGIAAEFEAKVKAAAEPIFATARAESYAKGRREGHREGYMLAVDCAVGMVRYHCDCTHADVPGLVELLKDDPTFGYKGLDTLPPSAHSPGIGDQDKEDGRG